MTKTSAGPQGALAIVGAWREVDDRDMDALIADIYSERARDTGRSVALESDVPSGLGHPQQPPPK